VHDFTVGTASTPTLGAPPAPGRIAYLKGEPIEFSPGQIVRLFWAKVNRAGQGGCWEWTGKTIPNGYGQIAIAKRHLYSHRVSFEIHNGQIPSGLHIDHLCRNRACCNPAHLEAVACSENLRRSSIAPATINVAKTHCIRGHEFNEANTYVAPPRKGNPNGQRVCRPCARTTDAARRAARGQR
jgi:hypothetical protein